MPTGDVIRLPAPPVNHTRLQLQLRLAALQGERRATAAARPLHEIDLDIAEVHQQLQEDR